MNLSLARQLNRSKAFKLDEPIDTEEVDFQWQKYTFYISIEGEPSGDSLAKFYDLLLIAQN